MDLTKIGTSSERAHVARLLAGVLLRGVALARVCLCWLCMRFQMARVVSYHGRDTNGSPSFSLYPVIIVRQYPIQEFVWDHEFAQDIHHKNSLEHDALSAWGVHIMQHILPDG